MRISPEDERRIAREIQEAERGARAAIAGIDEAEGILHRRLKRAERTRAGAVDRLIEAVAACEEVARSDAEVRAAVDEARHHLSRASDLRWRLAMSAQQVARGEARKLACATMTYEDLLQEGYIGLMRAAKRFDPDRGIRFPTYARWWVRAQMTRALETKGRMVRLPGGAVELIRNLNQAAARFDQMGIEYDLSDLADEVGVETARAELLLAQGNIFSIDQPDQDGVRFTERVADEAPRLDPHGNTLRVQAHARVSRAFDSVLDDRERFILVNHFGLDGEEPRTMSVIGQHLGLSRERVRQIEVAAIERLRRLV